MPNVPGIHAAGLGGALAGPRAAAACDVVTRTHASKTASSSEAVCCAAQRGVRRDWYCIWTSRCDAHDRPRNRQPEAEKARQVSCPVWQKPPFRSTWTYREDSMIGG